MKMAVTGAYNSRIMTDKLENKLKKFNYKYKIIDENEIILFSEFNIEINIIKVNEKIIIKDKIKGWNPLLGYISTSISSALKKTTIGLIICLIVIEIIKIYRDFNPNTYLIIFGIWEIIWIFFYLLKITTIKNRIINWLS